MKVPFVDLSYQENQIRTERERRFAEVINNSAFIGGKDIDSFEGNFATHCGTDYAVTVGNGTDALALIYRSIGIGKDDEVIVIPTTFIASVSPLFELGAKPVFVDIDPQTRNFDMKLLEAAIHEKTKAILAVHLYGIMPDMDALMAIADSHGIALIEDACQAHGAMYKGRRAGSFGKAAAFSFYPGKNLGAYGDGGAVTTNDEMIQTKLRMLRNHGGIKKYEHEIIGMNSRLDTLQAVVLDEKLKHLPEWNEQRRYIAGRYLKEMDDLPITLPLYLPDTEPVWHLFVVEVPENRKAFMDFMEKEGVATGIHYPVPLHLTDAFRFLGYEKGDFPYAEKLALNCVSLPMYPGMTDEQVSYVVSMIRSYFHAK